MSTSLLSNSEFISKIIQDSQAGRYFVPLVGSGLSSPSGIIMGMEFTNYLAFTAYLVLSDPNDRERTHGEGLQSHWDLRHQGWPPLPSNQEVERARSWVFNEFKVICKRYDLVPNPEEGTQKIRSLNTSRSRPPTHEVLASLLHPQVPAVLAAADLVRPDESVRRVADMLLRGAARNSHSQSAAADMLLSDSTRSYRDKIVEMGIRALHDWRETLVFLSSVEVTTDGLAFCSPNSSVIDRFNSFITRDKQPNLGHKMLAHLSGPLRIHAVLSTNFDTLIEDAFRALNLRIRVLPVSSKGQLPEPQTVGADLSVIKLHGEVHDTRADLTLDEEPVDEDKATFVAYMTRGAGNLRRGVPKTPNSKRLLVIGYSGADHRCVQMIKHWLEKGVEKSTGATGTPGQLVYWVCFSKADVDKVSELFGAREYDNCVRVTQSSRPDLLLYELYQRLVLALPPGGLTYEFTHVVPPRRLRPFDYPEIQIANVLSCAKTLEHPLEAARVLLSEKESLEDAKRLSRDSAVLELKRLVLDIVNAQASFYDKNGQYNPIRVGQSIAALWSPNYREQRLPRQQGDDDRDLFNEFDSRPVMIDSLGGVVRGVSLAVDELTASSPRKVFWLETQDYMDADAMLRDLLRSIAVRCGSYQGRQVTQHPLTRSLSSLNNSQEREECSKEIAAHLKRVLVDYRIDANQIIVLLYGRDSYGGCSGLVSSPWHPIGLATNGQAFAGRSSEILSLHCVIEALGRAGVPTVYFPLTRTRALRKNQFPKPGTSRIWEQPPYESRPYSNTMI
jgi:hypothetical protein